MVTHVHDISIKWCCRRWVLSAQHYTKIWFCFCTLFFQLLHWCDGMQIYMSLYSSMHVRFNLFRYFMHAARQYNYYISQITCIFGICVDFFNAQCCDSRLLQKCRNSGACGDHVLFCSFLLRPLTGFINLNWACDLQTPSQTDKQFSELDIFRW